MNSAQWWLTWWLRLSAGVLLLALVAVVLPQSWMAQTNDWLGFSPLPDTPLVGYLTRSLSGAYALLGVLTLALASDVRRYAPLIACFGWGYLVFGVILLVIDFAVGMPLAWALIEGPVVIGSGTVQLWLLARLGRDESSVR